MFINVHVQFSSSKSGSYPCVPCMESSPLSKSDNEVKDHLHEKEVKDKTHDNLACRVLVKEW